MKKTIIAFFLSIILVTGCTNNLNTPTKAVESYLNKYQNLDGEVTAQLDNVISSDVTMSDDQKKAYRDLMINQYKNMSYKVVDENITSNEAEVEVELDLLDYASNISESRNYYKKHLDEFEDTTDSSIDKVDNISSFIEYKIKNMKNVTNRRKENITFYLSKIDNEWVVDDLSDNDMEKLHGLYEE